MESKKKCFVISPIGDEGTPMRQEADGLLWITRNALEKYNFDVIRVDQIARSTIITNEIIQLIQESELCIMILTGENANVFYETGRRHETGKPFIQLIKKGERIPFDVAGIRTIIYDNIDSLPSAAKLITEIQKYVEDLEKTGYGTTGTGVSISTIAVSLDRIERKLTNFMINAVPSLPNSSTANTSVTDGFVFDTNIRESFMAAVAQGNVNRAVALLPRLEQMLGPGRELVAAAGLLSRLGYEPAVDLIYNLITEHPDEVIGTDLRGARAAVSAMVQFYSNTDREAEGLPRVEPIVNQLIALPEIDSENKAFFINQVQMLLYGLRQFDKALSATEQVLTLAPNDPAYIYNASLIYEKLGLRQKAIDMVDRYMAMDMESVDAVHLRHAVETYVESGRTAEARAAFMELRKADSAKAAVVLMDPDVRRAITG